VSARRTHNVAASVHQRLLNQAKATNRPFNEQLQHYAMERFLYRLSISKHAERFILKGALLLRVWNAPSVRPTMDIDLLGQTSNEPDSLVLIIQEICQQPVEEDGLEFDVGSVTARVIAEEAGYSGVRLRFRGHLGTARVSLQVDVGFGDVVTPPPSMVDYPILLDAPAPRLLAYPREAAIAEKLQVMLYRGSLNSRLRDYYDIWLLSQGFSFDGAVLATAVRETCSHRGTDVVATPPGLSEAFASDPARVTQWGAFRQKSRLDQGPEELGHLVRAVADFLRPILEALSEGRGFQLQWRPAGPWED
jgi:predicted nucleotidyltransferase component of viral defense system